MYTALYFALLIVVLIFSLYTFRKDVLQKFKTGSQTQIHGFKLTKEGLVRQLSIKRVVKYLASTIGFAFSISLVISILVLAVSSSFHLKNQYSKETFGIQFDYMIRFNEHADASTVFEATKQYSEVQAQIDKNESILFTDHSLWEGNTAYYKSSEIVFYNEIKEFVPLYSGTYPPHWSEIKGDPPSYDQSALASRRHLDRRTRTGKKNSVESDYLFYYPDISSTYEQAYNIYGKVNALYNNGWALSAYRPFYDGPFEDTIIHTQQYVLNLKEDVNVKEFEAMLDSFKVEYTQYQELIDSFQENNNSMNATALLISMTVAILMSILLAINISGLIVSARMEVSEDDVLFKKLGISSMLLKKVTSSVLILRVLASVGFLFILISIIYPFFFQDLLSAFGLFSMPGSILVPFVILCIVVVLILMYIFSKMSKDIKSQ